MGIGSLLGVLAAVPMGGYAFRFRIGSAKVWKILFLLQSIGFAIVLGVVIREQIPTGGVTTEFSPFFLLALPAAFLILYPWFRYAYRSPEIWEPRTL